MKATDATLSNPGYGIKTGDPITRSHVECVVVYCDLTDFCTAFSATFRTKFFGETIESVKQRNSSYFHVSRGLREAVECFGKSGFQDSGPFYSGMSCLLLLDQIGIRLNGPTSTSKTRAIAIRFAKEHGIVLKMDIGRPHLCFLNCVPFSQFPEEDERLFIGGRFRLMIKSVLLMEGFQNFAHFFGVLSIFDCLVSGSAIYKDKLPNEKHVSKLDHLIKWSLKKLEEEEATYSDFIYQTFDCFRRSKTAISVAPFLMNKEYLKKYNEHIAYSVTKRRWNEEQSSIEMNWNALFGIFPNVNKVTIATGAGHYGFSLSVLLKKLSNEVFPEHDNLESVVLTELCFAVEKQEVEDLVKDLDVSKLRLTLDEYKNGGSLCFIRV